MFLGYGAIRTTVDHEKKLALASIIISGTTTVYLKTDKNPGNFIPSRHSVNIDLSSLTSFYEFSRSCFYNKNIKKIEPVFHNLCYIILPYAKIIKPCIKTLKNVLHVNGSFRILQLF